MLFFTIVAIACISSFVSALAIFSALAVAGRNRHVDNNEPVVNEMFPSLKFRTTVFDEATLKRLVDSI